MGDSGISSLYGFVVASFGIDGLGGVATFCSVVADFFNGSLSDSGIVGHRDFDLRFRAIFDRLSRFHSDRDV